MSTSCSSAMERGPSSPSSSSRLEVLAPIDGLDIRILESNPPQYMLNVRAGLPSGCAERNRHETKRNAETLTVTVLNWMPDCTSASRESSRHEAREEIDTSSSGPDD